MAWTTFPTLTDGQVLTGAHMQIVRDNFAETAAAKATTAGSHFAGTGANTLAERLIDVQAVNTVQTTTSATYANLATVGPEVVLTTGPKALVVVSSRVSNGTAGQNSWVSYEVTGASSVSASDNYALGYDSPVINSTAYLSYATIEPSLVSGSNTFRMKYRVNGGTGTFSSRRLSVIPF
jgi:hypothetical protein